MQLKGLNKSAVLFFALAALSIALPASAYNTMLPLSCVWPWQLDHDYITCSTGSGCTSYHVADADCEWDGFAEHANDFDLAGYVPDTHWSMQARTSTHSIKTQVGLHLTGLNDPDALYDYTFTEQTGGFDVVAGRIYNLWRYKKPATSELQLQVICPGGFGFSWSSMNGGSPAAWIAPATEQCLLFTRTICSQDASQSQPVHKVCVTDAGVVSVP